MQRVDQNLAATAAGMLPAQASTDRTLRTRYRTLRVMCHSSGLAATYAYAASKSRGDKDPAPAYRLVCQGIGDRLVALELLPDAHARQPRQVLARLGDMDAMEYLTASAQITALLGWLARLADAGLEPAVAEDDDAS